LELSKLDSSLKRNTAFVKKFKAGGLEEQRVSLLADVQALNLTRYISELAQAIAEATPKYRAADIPVALQASVFCGN
jgi:regulator of nonsense transcripts 2